MLWRIDAAAIGRLFSTRVPVRGTAGYVWMVVALNAAAWFAGILPGPTNHGEPGYLRGTGLTTNVVFVQDLAWWLPLMAVAGAWLWRRRPWGYLIAAAGLVAWPIESVSVAVDQWYGHAADPGSTVVSQSLVPAFAVIALVGLVPLCYLLRDFSSGQTRPGNALPVAGQRRWPTLVFAALALVVSASAILGGIALMRDGFGIPLSWLSHTPFTSWWLPRLALLIGVAVPQLTVLALIALSDRWALAHRWALAASYTPGTLLVAWIAMQLLVLQRYFVVQPAVAAVGIAEIILAWAWQRIATVSPR